MRVAILGAGSIAYGNAALLASLGHEPVLWSPSGKTGQSIVAGKPLAATGSLDGSFKVTMATNAGDAIVLRRRPDRPSIGFRVISHAAQFQKCKAAATQADAFLPIKHRSWTVELDRQRDHHHQGQGEHEQRTSHDQIGGPLQINN